MKKILPLLVLIGASTQFAFSQGEFLRRGKSGFEASAGYSKDREANGVRLGAGYSFRGFLDVGVIYTKADNGPVTGSVISPVITYYPIKQEDARRAPTVGISVGYSHYVSKIITPFNKPDTVITTWSVEPLVKETSVNAINLGVSVYHRIGSWRMFFFQPMMAARVSMTNSGLKSMVSGGVSIGSRFLRGPLAVLTPAIEQQSGLTMFVLTGSLVF